MSSKKLKIKPNYVSLSIFKDIEEPMLFGENYIIVQPSEEKLKEIYDESYYHTDFDKICQICGVKFKHGRSNSHLCNNHKIYCTCSNPKCSLFHKINIDSLSGTATNATINAIENGNKILHPCSVTCRTTIAGSSEKSIEHAKENCDKMNKRIKKFCPICGKFTDHNDYGTCMECNKMYENSYCEKCKDYTKHKWGKCTICYPIGFHKDYCNKCKKITTFNNSICTVCHPESNNRYGSENELNENLFNFKFKISCNKKCIFINICNNKDKENNLKNEFGYCKIFIDSNINSIFKFCDICKMETPHKYNSNLNELYCQCCAKEKILDKNNNIFLNIKDFIKNEKEKEELKNELKLIKSKNFNENDLQYLTYKANKNNQNLIDYVNSMLYCPIHKRFEDLNQYNNEKIPIRIHFEFCECCNQLTPHKYHQTTKEPYCLVCEDEYIWCEQCGVFGPIEKHSDPKHTLYYASEVTQWINENPEIVSYLENEIVGFNKIIESSKSGNVCGIYGLFINNNSTYVGESANILFRSYYHMMKIVEESEYWYNIIDYLDFNNLEIRILENINRNNTAYVNMGKNEFKQNVLKVKELEWINRLKPDSQKCDGTDHIRPIEERQLKINKIKVI